MNASKYKPFKTRNAEDPPLNPPPRLKAPGGLYWEIALK